MVFGRSHGRRQGRHKTLFVLNDEHKDNLVFKKMVWPPPTPPCGGGVTPKGSFAGALRARAPPFRRPLSPEGGAAGTGGGGTPLPPRGSGVRGGAAGTGGGLRPPLRPPSGARKERKARRPAFGRRGAARDSSSRGHETSSGLS